MKPELIQNKRGRYIHILLIFLDLLPPNGPRKEVYPKIEVASLLYYYLFYGWKLSIYICSVFQCVTQLYNNLASIKSNKISYSGFIGINILQELQ